MQVRTLFPLMLAAALLGACATPTPTEHPEASDTPELPRPVKPVLPKAAPEVQAKRLDAVHAGLAAALRGQEVEITRLAPDLLRLRIAGRMAFAANEPKPLPPLLALLDRIADELKKEPATQIEVEAHTDSLGREVFNQDLSARRADVAVAHLASRGVAYGRLTARGKGEAQPVADNATEAGRASNRRLDILIRGD